MSFGPAALTQPGAGRQRPALDPQLAAAFGDGLEALERDLFRLRPDATNYQWYVFEAYPHQMRFLFPDHELIGS